MTFGEEWGWGSSVQESEAILARFLEQGGNFIDTANGYTLGHSETIIGEALAHDRSRRARIVIATKFYTMSEPPLMFPTTPPSFSRLVRNADHSERSRIL